MPSRAALSVEGIQGIIPACAATRPLLLSQGLGGKHTCHRPVTWSLAAGSSTLPGNLEKLMCSGFPRKDHKQGSSGKDNADLDVQDAIIGITRHVYICPDFEGLWRQPALDVLHEGLPHIICEHSNGLTPIDFLQDKGCSHVQQDFARVMRVVSDSNCPRWEGFFFSCLLSAGKHRLSCHQVILAALDGYMLVEPFKEEHTLVPPAVAGYS